MAVFYLRNSKDPDGKIVPVTVALSLDGVKSYQFQTRPDQDPLASGTELPNLFDPEGDQQWILVVDTPEKDSLGNDIPAEIINVVTTGTVHQEIEAAIGRIGQKVPWGTLSPDLRAPKITEFTPPLTSGTNVSIYSNVVARLQDQLPAAGMDLSTVKIKVNGFDVTSTTEITGNPFDLNLIYRPKRILG